MIRSSLMLALLLALGGFATQSQASAKGWDEQSSGCDPAYVTKCGDALAPPVANAPKANSAAKSDSAKKHQLTEMIRLHQNELLSEEAARTTASRVPDDKHL